MMGGKTLFSQTKMINYYPEEYLRSTDQPAVVLNLPMSLRPSGNCSSDTTDFPVFHGSVHTASLAVCTVLVIFVLVMGCFGNGIVIISALKFKKLRTNFDVLILNLTGADFITCICLAPIFLFLLFSDPPSPKMFCSSILFLGTISGTLSLLSLVAIALHRLARVIGRAKATLSLTRTGIILAMIWITSLAIAFGGTFHVTLNWDDNSRNCQSIINGPDRKMQNFILFFVAPVVIVSFTIIAMSYVVIAWSVHKQNRLMIDRSSTHRGSYPREILDKQCREFITDRRKKNNSVSYCSSCSNQILLDKENKALTMCSVVILTIGLCWGPLIISQFVELATGESIIIYQVKLCGIALVFLNGALDPYIYAQHIGKIKQSCSKIYRFVLGCKPKGRSRTKWRGRGSPNVETNRTRSHPLNDDTNSVQLLPQASNIKKLLLDKCVSQSKLDKSNNFYKQNLLIQSNKGKLDQRLCGKLAAAKHCQIDVDSVEHGNGFINSSCSQVSPKDGFSLMETP